MFVREKLLGWGRDAPKTAGGTPALRTAARALALFLLLLQTLAFAASPAANDDSTSAIRFIVQWLPQSQFAGYYVACDLGFYQKRGLKVEMVRGGPDRDPAEYLESGQADVATSFLASALVLRERGMPLILLTQIVNQSNQMLVAWRDMGIMTLQDLNGKKVSFWEGSFGLAFVALLKANHVSAHVVPQYYSVNLFLRRGVAACAAMDYNEYHMIYQAGIDEDELTTFPLKAYGFGFPEDGLYCLERTYRQRPEQFRAFAEASLEGWRYAAQHPAQALDIVMKYVEEARVPTNRPHMKWMLDKILPSILPGPKASWKLGELSPADYHRTAAMLKESGMIRSAPAFENFLGREDKLEK